MSELIHRIVLLGSGEASVPAFEALQRPPYQLIAVISQPDRPAGRGGRLAPTPLKVVAAQVGIPVLHAERGSDLPALIGGLGEVGAVVVIDFGQIIPETVFSQWPTVNLHFSLLPKYRGPTPIESQILAGETETGTTLIEVDAEIDHGPIISGESQALAPDTAAWSLKGELAHNGAALLSNDLRKYLNRERMSRPQDHTEATVTRKFTPADRSISWTQPALQIDRQIRAFASAPPDYPDQFIRSLRFPGATTVWAGQALKILEAELQISRTDLAPGQVAGDGLVVGAGSGALEIVRLQLAGKRELTAADFLRGYPQIQGAHLG